MKGLSLQHFIEANRPSTFGRYDILFSVFADLYLRKMKPAFDEHHVIFTVPHYNSGDPVEIRVDKGIQVEMGYEESIIPAGQVGSPHKNGAVAYSRTFRFDLVSDGISDPDVTLSFECALIAAGFTSSSVGGTVIPVTTVTVEAPERILRMVVPQGITAESESFLGKFPVGEFVFEWEFLENVRNFLAGCVLAFSGAGNAILLERVLASFVSLPQEVEMSEINQAAQGSNKSSGYSTGYNSLMDR